MSKRILLVDDEPKNLALLEAFLAPLGHETTRAGSGAEGLEAFERNRPDLVLLDLTMPGLDGLDVLTHIRATEEESHTPVILVTGRTEREDRLRGFEAGADEFLEKPVDRAILLARVGTLLRLKEAHDELKARNEALVRLQRDQRELTEFIVHDLKNPIGVVHLNLGWLRENIASPDPEIEEALRDAQEGSSRMQRMVEDLLAVARIEQAELRLSREPLALESLFDDVVRAQSREASERRITLRADVDRGLSVDADRAILRRVLDNLLSNSLQYTPPQGRIALSATQGDGVEIVVSNTGKPIPVEDQPVIFEKFRRGRGAAARPGHAGLGLYFCKRAMAAHGGHISLRQIAGWSTSFVLRFPEGGVELAKAAPE